MKGFLLDTNVIAEISGRRADARVLKWLEAQDENAVFLSVLTLGEYLKGIQNLAPEDARRPKLTADLAALEGRFLRRILPVSDAVVRRWGMLSGEIARKAGKRASLVDTLLAATAIEHDLYLVTRNLRDVAGTGAQVLSPWQDDS